MRIMTQIIRKIQKWLGIYTPTLFSQKVYLFGMVKLLEEENSSVEMSIDIGAHKRVGWLISKVQGEV